MRLNKRPRIWEDCLGRQQAELEAQAQVLVEQAAILLPRRHDIGPTPWDFGGEAAVHVCVSVCVWLNPQCGLTWHLGRFRRVPRLPCEPRAHRNLWLRVWTRDATWANPGC